MHRFEARSYRDFISSEIGKQPLLIDDMDAAVFKIGLGWRVRQIEDGADVTGVEQCTTFLNSLVANVLDELCVELKQLDRREFVEAVFRNYEAIQCDRDRWRRTARANIAIHMDQQAAIDTIVDHEAKLNACSVASRILLEAAICECPRSGGGHPGNLDISRLMARVVMIHYWGGYSDAIHWGAAEPHLRITPLGDVHFDHTFIDEVYDPFGRVGGEHQVRDAADRYEQQYKAVSEERSAADVLEPEFLTAWEREFGLSLENQLNFLMTLERTCLDDKQAVVFMHQSEIIDILNHVVGTTEEQGKAILSYFILPNRESWRLTTDGFGARDWYPWRFRRRLSALRRPFLKLDSGDDPEIAFAPGLVHDAFGLTLSALHQGEIPDTQMTTREMGSWLGSRNHRHRLLFNSAVSERLRELGWETRHEMRVTALLGYSLNKDYGDVDVVAYHRESRRVLMIECKDLQYHKTIGEVAEQLHDFLGELGSDGKRDLLRKHLDRVDVLKADTNTVAKRLHLPQPVQIEAHVVFKNPVPMKFVAKQLASKVRLSLFDELERL
jgi:hypothetical protein